MYVWFKGHVPPLPKSRCYVIFQVAKTHITSSQCAKPNTIDWLPCTCDTGLPVNLACTWNLNEASNQCSRHVQRHRLKTRHHDFVAALLWFISQMFCCLTYSNIVLIYSPRPFAASRWVVFVSKVKKHSQLARAKKQTKWLTSVTYWSMWATVGPDVVSWVSADWKTNFRAGWAGVIWL